MALKNDIKKINAGEAEHIPTLADLALKYGTISKDQHAHLLKLFAFKQERVGFEDLLRDEGMATAYQLELLKLIREYQIVRKSGEEFGKIAVEKGLATTIDINQALALQKNEFRKSRHKKLIGDILVENRILTVKQKNIILKEQKLFNLNDPVNGKSTSHETAGEGRGGDPEKQSEINIITGSDHLTAWVEIDRSIESAVLLSRVKDAVMTAGIVNGVYPDALINAFLIQVLISSRLPGWIILNCWRNNAVFCFIWVKRKVSQKRKEKVTSLLSEPVQLTAFKLKICMVSV